jgi:hypothetical protein
MERDGEAKGWGDGGTERRGTWRGERKRGDMKCEGEMEGLRERRTEGGLRDGKRWRDRGTG